MQPFARTRLYCPGPTPVSGEATVAMMETNIYHRDEAFKGAFGECRALLGPLIGAAQPPLIVSSSGTGAMEAAVVNLTAQGDPVLVFSAGKFGERWAKICDAFQCKVVLHESPLGDVPSPDFVFEKIKENPQCKAIFFQANETSTGVSPDVRAICKLVRAQFSGLIIVDAVSAVGAQEICFDEWGIDCIVAGSQKSFGVPPGIGLIALSDRAWKSLSKRPRFYFDLQREQREQTENQTAWTPPTSIILGLRAALKKMHDIGLGQIIRHHELMATAARAGFLALEIPLFAKKNPSTSVTSIEAPKGCSPKEILQEMRTSDGVIFAGGQDHLKGKILRMAHLGFVDRLDVVAGIAAFELALAKVRKTSVDGRGVAAALKVFQ